LQAVREGALDVVHLKGLLSADVLTQQQAPRLEFLPLKKEGEIVNYVALALEVAISQQPFFQAKKIRISEPEALYPIRCLHVDHPGFPFALVAAQAQQEVSTVFIKHRETHRNAYALNQQYNNVILKNLPGVALETGDALGVQESFDANNIRLYHGTYYGQDLGREERRVIRCQLYDSNDAEPKASVEAPVSLDDLRAAFTERPYEELLNDEIDHFEERIKIYPFETDLKRSLFYLQEQNR
jgi:hypothetical protein